MYFVRAMRLFFIFRFSVIIFFILRVFWASKNRDLNREISLNNTNIDIKIIYIYIYINRVVLFIIFLNSFFILKFEFNKEKLMAHKKKKKTVF